MLAASDFDLHSLSLNEFDGSIGNATAKAQGWVK